MESSNLRPKNLGMLFVIGGYGGSGASTIAKMLARHFNLNRIYAGGLMRDIAKSNGYDRYEDFLRNTSDSELKKFDEIVDKKMIKYSYLPNILLDSKIFAALSTKYRIPCTVKIWLTCDIETRARRKAKKSNLDITSVLTDLKVRYLSDKKRFEQLYNIDYSNPKKYNDIVIDTSKLNEYQTLNIILKLIKDGGYIRK